MKYFPSQNIYYYYIIIIFNLTFSFMYFGYFVVYYRITHDLFEQSRPIVTMKHDSHVDFPENCVITSVLPNNWICCSMLHLLILLVLQWSIHPNWLKHQLFCFHSLWLFGRMNSGFQPLGWDLGGYVLSFADATFLLLFLHSHIKLITWWVSCITSDGCSLPPASWGSPPHGLFF